MRAYLIDAAMQRIIEFDYNREHDAVDEILGCDERGGFTLGSGPLAPPRDCDSDGSDVEDCNVEDDFLADYCYVREAYPQITEPPPGLEPPWHILGEADGIKGDPRFWFQIDADLERSSFPIPGRGLIIGVTIDGDWCSARISLEQLTARVSFARRKLRGVTARRGIIPGEMWFGPVAPVTEESVNSGTWTRELKASPAGNVVPLKAPVTWVRRGQIDPGNLDKSTRPGTVTSEIAIDSGAEE